MFDVRDALKAKFSAYPQKLDSVIIVLRMGNLSPSGRQTIDKDMIRAAHEVVLDLKNFGASAVLVNLPYLEMASEAEIRMIMEMNNTGIVVFGQEPWFRYMQESFGRVIPVYSKEEKEVEHPTAGKYPLTWGVLAHYDGELIGNRVRRITPFGYKEHHDKYVVPDVSLEILRKYHNYDNTVSVQQHASFLTFGEYKIPYFDDGSLYIVGSQFYPQNRIVVRTDDTSKTLTYVPLVYRSGGTSDYFKNKIVIVSWPHAMGLEVFDTTIYDSVIKMMLRRDFITELTGWQKPLLLLLMLLASGLVCIKYRPLESILLLIAILFGFVVLNISLFIVSNVLVPFVTPLLIIVLCGITLPSVKLSVEKKNAELEKRKILESQKDQLEKEVAERTTELRNEKEKSDRLLYNILPRDIADELKESGVTPAKRFEEVSILFTDFRGFTATVASVPASRLVDELNDIFHHVDDIVERHGLEKIKTIGDAYMAVAGLPKESNIHAVQTVKAALEVLRYIDERNKSSFIKWEMRAGIHSGTVVAGVVGKWKFTYDVWGDAVNIANRLESSGVPGKVNISAYTYDLVKGQFNCEYRGKIDAKGKGEIDMYFVVDEKSHAI
jgi:class 3 adenylate cyclase